MKALMIKDILNMRVQGKIYALMLVFFGIQSFVQKDPTFLSGMLIMLSVFAVIAAISYDERANWYKYGLTMPISRKDIVLQKYLLGFALMFCTYILNAIISILVDINQIKSVLLSSLIIVAVATIFLAYMLPIIFKYGVEKGRIAIFVGVLIPVAGTMFIPILGIDKPNEQTIINILYLLPLIAVAATVISVLISIQIFNHKEF